MEGSPSGITTTRALKSTLNHPFCCDKCPGSFTRKEHLLRHYRTHDNVKPYECTVCHQTFGRKDLRDRHERNLHQTVRTTTSRKQAEPANNTLIDQPLAPAHNRATTPTIPSEQQQQLLSLYFAEFSPSLPVIHRSTFRPERHDPGLVRCMAAIGGHYTSDPSLAKTAISLLQEESVAIKRALSAMRPDDVRLTDLLMEVLLLVTYGLSQTMGDPVEDSRDLLLEAIRLGRKIGFGKALVGMPSRAPATLHYRWIEWVRYETFKRLNLLYHVIDSITSCLRNHKPHLSLLELRQNMPVDEMIWNASTAEEWQAACVAVSANSEAPLAEAMYLLVNSYTLSTSLNELSSLALSCCLLNDILELSVWRSLYLTHAAIDKRPQQQFGIGPIYCEEINTREIQLKFAMNILLEGSRNRRLAAHSSSPIWEFTSAVQQFSYLRLFLPYVSNTFGVASDTGFAISEETIHAVVREDLGNVNYYHITLLLNWFIELMLSHVHANYQDSTTLARKEYLVSESSIGCVILIQVMLDIWRTLRFTFLHQDQIARQSDLVLAQRSFFATIHELIGAVGLMDDVAIIREDVLARVLAQLCSNMYHATKMSSFRFAAERFTLLVQVVQKPPSDLVGLPDSGLALNAWTMLSRCI